jgi:hypothetical protein
MSKSLSNVMIAEILSLSEPAAIFWGFIWIIIFRGGSLKQRCCIVWSNTKDSASRAVFRVYVSFNAEPLCRGRQNPKKLICQLRWQISFFGFWFLLCQGTYIMCLQPYINGGYSWQKKMIVMVKSLKISW